MRVLVLEDNPSRVRAFKCRFAEQGWTALFTHTAQDCIRALQKDAFDYVFLDHDLDGEMQDTSDPHTGSEVARWWRDAEDHPNRRARVVIHSFNREGAAYMEAAIFGSVYVPGVWLPDEFTLILEPGCTFWDGRRDQ